MSKFGLEFLSNFQLELTPGPYSKPIENDFVNWSPNEGEAKAELFEKWYRVAAIGDTYR